MDKNVEKQHTVIRNVLSKATVEEKDALSLWAEQLLLIKQSEHSNLIKGKEAIKVTVKSKVIIHILKTMARELKLDQIDASRIKSFSPKSFSKNLYGTWKKRSLPVRLGLGASTVTMIVFGSQGAGIAALGTAIGVPLWVVFGAGATFAGVIYEEITGKKVDLSTHYEIIEGRKTPKNKIMQRLKNISSSKK